MSPRRILIADDASAIRRMLFRFFDNLGYDCISASSGAECLSKACRLSPDVIILDLRLGDITGFEVLKQLRSDAGTSKIPVIIMSGASERELLAAAARCADADAYIQKGEPLETFQREVERVSRQRPTVAVTRGTMIERGCLTIDLSRRKVLVKGNEVALGPRRFAALCALANSREGLTGKTLDALVGSGDELSHNTVARTMNRLKNDLAAAAGEELILTIPGGYKLRR